MPGYQLFHYHTSITKKRDSPPRFGLENRLARWVSFQVDPSSVAVAMFTVGGFGGGRVGVVAAQSGLDRADRHGNRKP